MISGKVRADTIAGAPVLDIFANSNDLACNVGARNGVLLLAEGVLAFCDNEITVLVSRLNEDEGQVSFLHIVGLMQKTHVQGYSMYFDKDLGGFEGPNWGFLDLQLVEAFRLGGIVTISSRSQTRKIGNIP